MKMITSFKDINNIKNQVKNPIILYSGGLDSSYLVAYLKNTYNFNITALRVDVGQSDLGDIGSLNTIGVQELLIDTKKEFIDNFVSKSLHNGGFYGYGHFLSASLTRPLLAKKAVELAKEIGSNCIFHCAIPSQNSNRRFNTSIKDLGFEGYYGSPFTDEDQSREEKIDYLEGLELYVNKKRNFSIDTNLWCREFEAGSLDQIDSFNINEDMFLWTQKHNTTPRQMTLTFEQGCIIAINNKEIDLMQAVQYLNQEVGGYGIGRQVSLEEGPLRKVVEARECPAAVILSKAIYDLMSLNLSRSLVESKIQQDQRWATLACEGAWFSKEKIAIESYNRSIMNHISGTITYNLSSNSITLNGITQKVIKNKVENYAVAA